MDTMPGSDKRHTPACGIDEQAGQQGGACYPQIAKDPVDRDDDPGFFSTVNNQSEPHRMVNGGKCPNKCQAERNLNR